MKFKRIVFWLILIAFAFLTIWWIFYFPFSREKLYRAIPANAMFVSEHINVAERWKSIAQNPLTLCVLSTAGFKQKNLNEAVMDPSLVSMLESFASRNTVIAYVPALGNGGEPAWVLSSWVGGSGQIFKWYTSGMLAKANLRKVRLEGGRQIWRILKKDQPSDPDLSLAMVEGVILACISTDPSGVRFMIERIERGAALSADLRAQMDAGASAIATNGIMDRGYLQFRNKNSDDSKVWKMAYEFSEFSQNTLKGNITGDMDFLLDRMASFNTQVSSNKGVAGYNLNNAPALQDLPALFGREPDLFAIVPFSIMEPLLTGRYVSRAVRIISRTVKQQSSPDSAIFLSMFSGDLSGRILGIKVPALVTGVTVDDNCNYAARISETVDVLNALYKTSLIPRKDEIEGRVVIAIDSTRQQGVYDSIAPTDKPAITLKDHWLMMSSSLGTLSNVVCASSTVKDEQSWVKGTGNLTNCAGYAWINLESTGNAIKNAIAAYSLVLIAQNSPNTAEIRKTLALVQTWLNVVKPVKACELKLSTNDSSFELLFAFGKD